MKRPAWTCPRIDFVSLAKGYGVARRASTTRQDLRCALEKAFAANGPVLIEARTYFD